MTDTALAARARQVVRHFQDAAVLETVSPVTFSDMALNPLRAERARDEGVRLLEAPDQLIGAGSSELAPAVPLVERETDEAYLLDTLEYPNTISLAASQQRTHLASGANVLSPALDLAVSAKASNSLEKMLCHQLASAHQGAMELMRRVEVPLHPLQPADLARLTNAAARLMEVYQAGCLTLQKLKLRGKQHVVVQYQQVNVGPGGQAIVAGKVRARARGRRRQNGR
jgi:hypothetical protein